MDISAVHNPIILTSIVGIVVWVVWALLHKRRWLYSVPPLTYLINALLFFTFASCGILSRYSYNIWSDVVQLHGVFLMVMVGIAFILSEHKWTRPQ